MAMATHPQPLTYLGYAPVWSPDSARLLFETQCLRGSTIEATRLEVAALDGTDLSKVADLRDLTSYAWRP